MRHNSYIQAKEAFQPGVGVSMKLMKSLPPLSKFGSYLSPSWLGGNGF